MVFTEGKTGDLIKSDYDPFAHRNVKKPVGIFGSLAHMWKASLGTGIFAMPFAFSNFGLMMGSIGIVCIGFLYTHCIYVLVETSQKLCKITKTPMLDYAETAEKAFELGPRSLRKFSKAIRAIIDYGILFTTITGSLFIVFAATTLKDIVEYLFDVNMQLRIYILIVAVPVLFISQIRYLRLLVPFSYIGNALFLATVCIMFYYICTQEINFSDKPLVAQPQKWAKFFSITTFAVANFSIILALENNMAEPQKFLGKFGVLNCGMLAIVLLYGIVGFFGYACFGDETAGSVTSNLPAVEVLGLIAKALIGIAMLLSINIIVFVFMDILWKKIGTSIKKEKHNLAQILIRIGVSVVLTVFAIAIPNLGAFMGLLGCLLLTMLSYFLPIVVETIYLYPDGFGKFKWRLWKNVLIMLLSLAFFAIGLYFSVLEIIHLYN